MPIPILTRTSDVDAVSTLQADLTAIATTLTLRSASSIPVGNFSVQIDAEILYVMIRVGTLCSGLLRGEHLTLPATHAAGATVRVCACVIVANHVYDLPSSSSAVAWADITGKPTTFAPELHKTTHENGGSDELSVVGLSGVLADPQPPIIGSGATQAVAGNDVRLTNARTPLAHAASHQNAGGDEISVVGLSGLLADGQTPLAHATSHKSGGSDAIKLDELAAPTDVTTLDATTIQHGLMKKYPGGTTNFLREDGTFAAPTAVASVTYTPFTKDLGVSRRSGTFDITGLSGLTANKPVSMFQTAAAIASKGNARDEGEMDHINLSGYVVDATTIRAYWQAPAVVVGTFAFAYLVSA